MRTRGRSWKLLAAALSLAGSAPALAAGLEPAGKWIVNFDTAQCFATRAFGSGGSQVTFAVKPAPVGEVVQLALLRDGSQTIPEQRPMRLYVDDRPPIASSIWVHDAGVDGKRSAMVFRTNVSAATFEQLRMASQMRVEVGQSPQTQYAEPRRPSVNIRYDANTLNLTLTLMQLPDVTDRLKDCVGRLQDIWNVGEAHASRLKQGPRPRKPLERLLSRNDYPDDATLLGQEGTTRFVLLVDEQGKVVDCAIVESSGFAALDAQTCALAQLRAEFAPAVGVDGKPAKAVAIASYRWAR